MMKSSFKRPFARFVKKPHKPLQLAIEDAVAYRPPAAQTHRQSVNVDAVTIVFYQIGSHENFYAELKRYLKSEG